jgi:uncharacterized repeat protein (TIGR03803 family)
VEDSSGNLFGTTVDGGYGRVFEIQQGTGTITPLASFEGPNGATPYGGVIEDNSGNLFGTTLGGGPGFSGSGTGDGTVFEIQAGTHALTTLASFNGTNGAGPNGVIEDSNGNLFGTTQSGGLYGNGTVFEVQAGSGTITTLANFSVASNAFAPSAGLVMDSKGNLFGTTSEGGPSNAGAVFEVQAGSGSATTLASFNGTNGFRPMAGLIEDSSGNLFGTTSGGGTSSDGTLFEVQAGSGTVTTLASFNGTNGADPEDSLIEDINGNLFGTTAGSVSGYGTVFEMQAGSGTIVTLASFNGTNGARPLGALVEDSSGDLFGTASQGAQGWDPANSQPGDGTVFEVQAAVTITTAMLSNGQAGVAYNQTISATGGVTPYNFKTSSGTVPPGLSLSNSGVLTGTPTAVGTYSFTVTATDPAGASASQAYSISISPGPLNKYLVTVQGSTSVAAGNSFIVTVQAADKLGNPITNYSGPGLVVANVSPSSAASNFPVTVPINSFGFGFFQANLEQVGAYTITVSSGLFTGSAGPVTVTPGRAAALAFAAQPVNTPTGVTLPTVNVQLVDAYGNVITTDNTDLVSLSVGSGPGPGAPGFTAGSTTTATLQNGVATFNNLTLVVPGAYKLSAVLPEHFVVSSAAFNVLPLQVVPGSFVGTPSGFSLQFNAPFLVNSLTPVLYGQGFGAAAPVPTVRLTGPSGPVEGSMIVNATTNSLTFVETDTASEVNNNTPILPDGTYSVDITSSAATDGLQAFYPGGGFLDGTNSGTPGHDFTTTFTVAAANDDVLWVPGSADGPGQALEAPGDNQSGGGYPLYLDTSPAVPPTTAVQATLTYNPALLTVTPTSTSTFTVAVPTAGAAVLTYNGPALSGTQVPVGVITAMVPGGTAGIPTPYKAKDLLHLSAVTINGSASNVVTADGMHLVAYVGDADGNGGYSSNDAALLTRAALQLDSGFSAYPLVDPVIVGDIDGAGYIPPDASLQVNEAGVNVATANLPSPPIPPSVHFRAIANNVDPTVSIPADLQTGPDGTLTVPVNIDDAHPAGSSGLIRGQLALTYDPRQFTVSAADVHLGSVLAASTGWVLQVSINPITGEIGIALSSTTPIAQPLGGSLVTIDFHPIDGASGVPAIALVASVNPTGQQVITTELEDAQGAFTLTPAPANSFNSGI